MQAVPAPNASYILFSFAALTRSYILNSLMETLNSFRSCMSLIMLILVMPGRISWSNKARMLSKLRYAVASAWLSKAQLRRLDGFQARCLHSILKIPPSFLSRIGNEAVRNRVGVRTFVCGNCGSAGTLLCKRNCGESTQTHHFYIHNCSSVITIVQV